MIDKTSDLGWSKESQHKQRDVNPFTTTQPFLMLAIFKLLIHRDDTTPHNTHKGGCSEDNYSREQPS